MATPNQPDRARRKGIIGFLESNAIVGATAILAFILSASQLLWPVIKNAFSSYVVFFESPDIVNLFCAGSEGIDADVNRRPICDGSNSVVVVATPLFYINQGSEDKTVWLRRETVAINFLDQSARTVKEITLAWERVSADGRWYAPGVEQIEPNRAISHSTLFYPESRGCARDVPGPLCHAGNSFKWEDFADRVIRREITHAVFTFKPVFMGPDAQTSRMCRWTFTDGDVEDLEGWRDELERRRMKNPERTTPGSVFPPYALLSADCVPLEASP